MSPAFVSTVRIVAIGRLFFALGVAGIGFEHFFFRQFIPVVVPLWPQWIPGHSFWIYCVGALLLVCAGAILAGIQARAAAFVLGGFFLLSVVLLHVPARILAGSFGLGTWTERSCPGVSGSLLPRRRFGLRMQPLRNSRERLAVVAGMGA